MSLSDSQTPTSQNSPGSGSSGVFLKPAFIPKDHNSFVTQVWTWSSHPNPVVAVIIAAKRPLESMVLGVSALL